MHLPPAWGRGGGLNISEKVFARGVESEILIWVVVGGGSHNFEVKIKTA